MRTLLSEKCSISNKDSDTLTGRSQEQSVDSSYTHLTVTSRARASSPGGGGGACLPQYLR